MTSNKLVLKVNKRYIKKRKEQRKPIHGYISFTRGDIIAVSYRLKGLGFNFTGLCYSVRKKSMLSSNTSFSLRNVLAKIPVEVNFLLYGLCRMSYKILDYARKKVYYRSSKLYYLRVKTNKASWVQGF